MSFYIANPYHVPSPARIGHTQMIHGLKAGMFIEIRYGVGLTEEAV